MFHPALTTPCPILSPLDIAFNAANESTTTIVDFTTEFHKPLYNANPRRRQRQSVQFSIHEDNASLETQRDGKRATLLQPPKRVQAGTSSQDQKQESQQYHKRSSNNIERPIHTPSSRVSVLNKAPKRAQLPMSPLLENTIEPVQRQHASPKPQVSRPARRGTIYIPNEDTTMPSMYMGIFSPIKDLNMQSPAGSGSHQNLGVTGIAAQMANKRLSRKSVMSGTARRGTLQQSVSPPQPTASIEDKRGSGGGKENIPPNALRQNKLVPARRMSLAAKPSKQTSFVRSPVSAREPHSIYAPTASSLLRHEIPRTNGNLDSQMRPAWNGGSKPRTTQPSPVIDRPEASVPDQFASTTSKPRVPSRFVMPAVSTDLATQRFTILDEDIADPSIYEEDWLQHQEISMTQLVNNLFSESQSHPGYEYRTLRRQLLDQHCSESMVILQKRVQAALLYGALGIPRETLEHGARLQNDIGLRKSFTDLWLSTYDLEVLQVALEVVVGRECCSTRLSVSHSNKPKKTELRTFIEAFLIRNEDVKPEAEATSRTSWAYQRAVLRSLWLIKLLDVTKSERSIKWKANLFQHSSSHKSSVSVLQTLVQMLNPAAGDPVRALGHIGYQVSHVQHPLEEFDYGVSNLATDLRDGIRLTRLVELLLYPSASETLDNHYDGGTTTLLMPEGETIEFDSDQNWPLSQHLKTSCQSRAVKLWNVQLALSALQNVKGIDILTSGITANDIVDGYREKTVRLLWALVGKWGMPGLLDWWDLKWETRRLRNSFGLSDFQHEHDHDNHCNNDGRSFETCNGLLKQWARAVAATKGLAVRNFTTSFADGKVFEAIVDVYEPHIQTDNPQLHAKLALDKRLLQLGCSAQFAQLFADSRQSHIFDRDFVLSALTFLCSRLLAPSQRSRAATTIQRCWRQRWLRIEEHRKLEKKNVAFACASYVNSKQQVTTYTTNLPSSSNGLQSIISPVSHATECLSPMSQVSEDIWLTIH